MANAPTYNDAQGTEENSLGVVILNSDGTFADFSGGVGDASAANQTTQIMHESAMAAVLGTTADAASVTTTIKAALRAIAAAGTSASVTLTRTADTDPYTANDIIGAATGSTAALTFANMGLSGDSIMITSVSLEVDAAALISGETSYNLHLYSVTPPSALGDNAPFDLPSGDRASYLGSIVFGAPIDLGSTLYVQTEGVNKQVKLAGTSLFGYLVTVGAYTPTSARVYVIKLHAVRV